MVHERIDKIDHKHIHYIQHGKPKAETHELLQPCFPKARNGGNERKPDIDRPENDKDEQVNGGQCLDAHENQRRDNMCEGRYGTCQTRKGKGLQSIDIHAEHVPFYHIVGGHIDLGQGHLLPDGIPVFLGADKRGTEVVVEFKDGVCKLGVVEKDEHQRKPL